MSTNTTAVLEVVAEHRDASTLFRDIDNSSVDNSLILSPSMESFSTVHDIENLAELNVDNDTDLCVKIDNPQKVLDTLETYVTFQLTTKVARIEFDENEYIVRRRYNDFLWLRQKLAEAHPFCIIPPLPTKHTLLAQLDRYSKDFIYARMKALNIFMLRVVQHPILSCNQYLKLFLTVKGSDFSTIRKQKSLAPVASRSRNAQTIESQPDLTEESATAANGCVTPSNHHDFDRLRYYLVALNEKLLAFERITTRVSRDRQELVSELQHLYPVFVNWSEHEPELAPLLRSIASALERCCQAQQSLAQAHQADISVTVRDICQYVDIVINIVRKRDAMQTQYGAVTQELAKRKEEKDKLVASSEQTSLSGSSSSISSFWKATGNSQSHNDDRLEKLSVRIPQLVKTAESNQDALECANEQLRSDVDRWQQEKQELLKSLLLQFVNEQINYYEKAVQSWEAVTTRITKGEV